MSARNTTRRNRQAIPSQARDGRMRAWLDILNERHPEVTWIAARERRSPEAMAEEDSLETPVRATAKRKRVAA
jgi:hypothetical protein